MTRDASAQTDSILQKTYESVSTQCDQHESIEELNDLNESFLDKSLEDSNKKLHKADPDFCFHPEELEKEELVISVPKTCFPYEQQTFIIFQSNLEELLRFCPKCGSVVSDMDKRCYGTQLKYNLICLDGCVTEWFSQPKCSAVKGT